MNSALELHTWPLGPLAWVALWLLALALITWSYARQRELGPRRFAFAALRGLTLTGIVLLLADPRERVVTSEPVAQELAILLDVSQSAARSTLPPAVAALLGDADAAVTVHEFGSDETAIGDALDALRRSDVSHDTRGALLVSDGHNTAGRDPQAVARRFGEAGVPIHVVALGPTNAPTLRIDGLDGPDAIFLDDLLTLRAELRASDALGARAAVVLLRDGEELERRELVLEHDSTSLIFEPDAPRAGLFTYEVRATLQGDGSGDALAPAAERVRAKTVRVLDDPLRVLFVQDQPSWEWRFLRDALVRDPQIRRGFQTHLVTAAPQVAIAENEYLRDLPLSAAELADFDVVVLGDVAADTLPARFQTALREHVAEAGAGLLFLAGRRNDPRTLRGTVLEELLPVRLGDAAAGYLSAPVRAVPSARGGEHRALRLHAERPVNERIWRELPALRSSYQIEGAHPLATVLLHDELEPGRPLLIGRRFGAGQVAFSATDSTWLWRSLDDGVHYERYWGQLVRWLGIRRRSASAAAGRLTPHTEELELGGSVQLVARLASPEALEPQLELALRVGDEAPELTRLRRRAGAEPIYEGRFTPTRAGVHTAWVGRREHPDAWASFVVRPAPIESRASSPDLERLAQLAHASGGRLLEPDSVAAALEALGPAERERTRVERRYLPEPWNWVALLALVALLATEWIWRKLAGLK